MYIVKCHMWYIILVTRFSNFLLDATTGLAWRTVADITEFHIDFSYVIYNDTVGGNGCMLNLKNLCCFITF